MNLQQRESIVAEAESWLRTPYHANARVKGAGVDCAQLPFAVYSAVLKLNDVVLPSYVEQWHLHRNEEIYLRCVREAGFTEISQEAALPGDLVLWRIGHVHSHGAIITDWPRVIHAAKPRGVIRADASIDELLSRTSVSQPLFFTFNSSLNS